MWRKITSPIRLILLVIFYLNIESCGLQIKEKDLILTKITRDSLHYVKIENKTNTKAIILDYVVSCNCSEITIDTPKIILPDEQIFVNYKRKKIEDKSKVVLTLKTNLNPSFKTILLD